MTQLRNCSDADLDDLIRRWLTTLGFTAIRRVSRHAGTVTYQALTDHHLTSLPIWVRVFRRKNRAQVHHVDSFLGTLLRHHVTAGVLITTGDLSAEAITVAASVSVPRVQVLSGTAFAAELAHSAISVRRSRIAGWVLDLTRRVTQNGGML